MTTKKDREIAETIELKNPFNLAGGKEGARTIETLELATLRAAHLWDVPARDLGARHTLSVGMHLAGFQGKEITKAAQEISGSDIRRLTSYVNVAITRFQDGADAAIKAGVDPGSEHTITLEQPLMIAGEAVDELTLRPLKGKDVWEVPATDVAFGHIFQVGASQCGQADAIIKKLESWDAGQLVGVVNRFLSDFRETGE